MRWKNVLVSLMLHRSSWLELFFAKGRGLELFLGGKCNLDFIHSDSVSRALLVFLRSYCPLIYFYQPKADTQGAGAGGGCGLGTPSNSFK